MSRVSAGRWSAARPAIAAARVHDVREDRESCARAPVQALAPGRPRAQHERLAFVAPRCRVGEDERGPAELQADDDVADEPRAAHARADAVAQERGDRLRRLDEREPWRGDRPAGRCDVGPAEHRRVRRRGGRPPAARELRLARVDHPYGRRPPPAARPAGVDLHEVAPVARHRLGSAKRAQRRRCDAAFRRHDAHRRDGVLAGKRPRDEGACDRDGRELEEVERRLGLQSPRDHETVRGIDAGGDDLRLTGGEGGPRRGAGERGAGEREDGRAGSDEVPARARQAARTGRPEDRSCTAHPATVQRAPARDQRVLDRVAGRVGHSWPGG